RLRVHRPCRDERPHELGAADEVRRAARRRAEAGPRRGLRARRGTGGRAPLSQPRILSRAVARLARAAGHAAAARRDATRAIGDQRRASAAAKRAQALIGNMISAALVGRDGSIDWLCLPRFDSPACFAALLGTSENGRWIIAPTDAHESKRSYYSGTAILETRFATRGGEAALL